MISLVEILILLISIFIVLILSMIIFYCFITLLLCASKLDNNIIEEELKELI
jgi:hypothetical protein